MAQVLFEPYRDYLVTLSGRGQRANNWTRILVYLAPSTTPVTNE